MPKVGLAQCACAEGEEPLRKVESYTRRARSEGVELIVFPEALMRPIAGGRTPRELAEPLDGPLVSGVRRVAQSSGVWIIVDVYESRPDSDALPYNTAVVVDDCGEIQDVYRKCHLYDAHGERESDQTSAGDALGKPIHTPFCTLGVGICYDLRFPEMTRDLALAGCDLIVFPAAWHAGPCKEEHWETLLRARAIENECFVVGTCLAGSRYVGRSMVCDPLGRVLSKGPAGADGEALVTCDLDFGVLRSVRDAMPVFAHRRPDVY